MQHLDHDIRHYTIGAATLGSAESHNRPIRAMVNWGLVAFGGYEMDLVASLFGGVNSSISRLVYALVGLSALWQVVPWGRTFSVAEPLAESGRAPLNRM